MGVITKTLSGVVGGITGADAAADAAVSGANITAQAQREALEYLKEREAIPQQFREGALQQLGGLYGLKGGAKNALRTLRRSPMYDAILGSRAAGEEAILRNAAATGGLRSGNVQGALADYNIGLEQQALLQSLQGIQGLAQLPSNANQIAGQMSSIGEVLGQGQIAAGQAQQAGMGQALGLLTAGAGAFFSDRRLKDNIQLVGSDNGFNVYSWDWNNIAGDMLGLFGKSRGVIADEVEAINPSAVSERSGFKTVDYNMIGVAHG